MPDTASPTSDQMQAAARDKAAQLLGEIQAREKEFESGWWKKAENAENIYASDLKTRHEDEVPYNILYSNTEVLLPALYSATPKPDIRPRFKGMDVKPIPEMLSRFLTVAADPASPGSDSFDAAMADAVLAALVPGLGYVRIRLIESRAFPIVFESGSYRSLIWPKGSRWSKLPWIAFKHSMKKTQLGQQFEFDDAELAENFTPSSDNPDEKDDCTVYEVWHKASRTVLFLSDEWREKLLKETPDPLELENFFPTPGPLLLTQKPGKLAPVPLYNYYRNQAEELNRVSVRLNKVLSAIRVRGAYNGLLGDDLKRILASDELENELVPAAEAGLLAQSGGFDKHIWLLPIEKLITVAQELYKAREAIKQVIYELTGISDIIRGSSVASETATAQDLKNKWGTVRLRKMQTLVGNYARDLFRMTIDVGTSRVPAEKWQAIVQMPGLITQAARTIARQQVDYSTQQGLQPDQKYIQQLQGPTLEELLKRVASDQQRTFVVNIQTSSTVDLDTAQDKSEVQEFMTAMGQLLAGLQPLGALGASGMEAAKAILIAVCQRYKFGLDVADVIAKIEPTPPGNPQGQPQDSGKAALLEAETKLRMEEIASKQRILQAQEQAALYELYVAKEKQDISLQLARLRLNAPQATLPAQGNRRNASL